MPKKYSAAEVLESYGGVLVLGLGSDLADPDPARTRACMTSGESCSLSLTLPLEQWFQNQDPIFSLLFSLGLAPNLGLQSI